MELHTYRARSLAEALRLIRQELGPDASVLHTREVGSTLSRWLGGREIEVTASAVHAAPSRLPQPEDDEPQMPPAELQDFRRKFREDLLTQSPAAPSLVEQLSQPRICTSPSHARLRQRLLAGGISSGTADRWLARLDAELVCDPEAHPDRAQHRLRQIVESELPISGPIALAHPGPTVIALVGPTGVGKTTTLAKLAARFRLREQRRVALVTIDNFRIAAVEQLTTYAEIIHAPLEVVATPHEMRAAMQRLSDNDVILIDTPGRSPRDTAGLSELRSLLAAAEPHATLLVQSCVTGGQVLRQSADAFAGVGASRLILTKLDEAADIGQLPDWLAACGLPLCYTAHGQNVPDDMEPASAARLAGMLLGELDSISTHR
jgi:flagellar biosynthesis protein FlhF